MKFSEYLASFITPQMTLLEKFNALCKYLEEHNFFEGTVLYCHIINLDEEGNSTVKIISTRKEPYTNQIVDLWENDALFIMVYDDFLAKDIICKYFNFANGEYIDYEGYSYTFPLVSYSVQSYTPIIM